MLLPLIKIAIYIQLSYQTVLYSCGNLKVMFNNFIIHYIRFTDTFNMKTNYANNKQYNIM